MHESDLLIRTKLCPPFIRSGLVPRPRLQQQIALGLRSPLILIIAPAGFGKTTLLASCINCGGMPVAWLSLDKNDNQAGRFLSYLIAALQEADNTIGSESARLMGELQGGPPEAVLSSLINDLYTAGRGMTLVLDDYQFIHSQAVHEAVAFLLDHCPNTIHLVIATRSDPPLPLARLRARGQMVEIRAADLRFTTVEATQFLNDVMGLHLDSGSVAKLEERTEGWIAGLQMAALSMRGQDDVDGIIQAFAGTNRFIMDFMLEEVLAREPEEIQTFLLKTSILTRLTGSLCDAVTGLSGGQEMLRQLERRNLFVIPLDNTCGWYRYHHLFADLLRARLNQLYPGLSRCMHALAAAWYEENNFYEDAIQHALAADDYPEAARLVEVVAENAWLNGQYARILAWTRAIPAEVIYSRPWLCIWNAWAFTQTGVSESIDQWIAAAEQSTITQQEDLSSMNALDASQDVQVLMNEIVALKAFAVSFSQDYDRAIELGEAFLRNPPLRNKKIAQFTRCNVLHLLSSMYYATGNLHKAEQTCRATIDLANETGFTLRHLHAVNKLIMVNNVNGHLYRSYQLMEDTLSLLQARGIDHYFAASQLCFRKIQLLYEWNQLDDFQRLVESGINKEMLVDVPYLLVDAYNIQALDLLHKKDYSNAQDALNKAKALAQKSYIWEGLTWRTESLQVRLWLKKCYLSPAIAWASTQAADRDHNLSFTTESRAVARARILLAQRAYREATSLLSRLSDAGEVAGRNGSLIEIRVLQATALLGLGEQGAAVVEVERALALAEPEGYVRTFLDEGQPMLLLLSRIANDASSLHTKYALRLLEAFQEEDASSSSIVQPMISPDHRAVLHAIASGDLLIEPLSQRELEVLHLLALGKTNQEIAQTLIIAPGTVKAHTASIYRKLDASNRTEAAARARKLGILP
jgi:LuxR family maltose regulon positive regulatory protein